MVDRIREHCGAAIIIHTPPHIMPTDTNRAPHLPAYAEALRRIAKAKDAVLIDNHAEWSQLEYGAMTYLLSDAIHPNEMGHRLMARQMLQALDLWDPKSQTGKFFIP